MGRLSSQMQNRKLELVVALVQQLPPDHPVTVEQAMLSWWANIRSSGGMRLTATGYHVFKDFLDMESWSLDLSSVKTTITKRVILDLDKKLAWPYYIDLKNKRIEFFSSREAMMATLYGDIKQWLANYQP